MKRFDHVLALLIVACATVSAQDVAEGKRLLEAKKYRQAIAQFEGVLDKDSKNFDARYGLGRCFLALGQYDSATTHAVKAESLKPDDAADVIDGDRWDSSWEQCANHNPSPVFAKAIQRLVDKLRDSMDSDNHLGKTPFLPTRSPRNSD